MKFKAVSGIMLSLLLIAMLTLIFNIPNFQPVEASGSIHINADGSIDPPTANITSADNITYTFTDNNYDSIVVERDNIVVDGAGYTLQGTGIGYGVTLSGRNNITIKNIKIKVFRQGIHLQTSSGNIISGNHITNSYICIYLHSSSNTISGNTITNNSYGIWLDASSIKNFISGNTITNNSYGIHLYYCGNFISGNTITNNEYGIHLYHSLCTISGNTITNNSYGIWLDDFSNNNFISGNKITNNEYGIRLISSSGNSIFHNDFVGNTVQALNDGSTNVWDDGYPSGGNYWSDYTGVDLYSGPDQDQPGSDGIGDTPYNIDANNIDHYPFLQTLGFYIVVSPSTGTTAQGTTVTTNVYVSASAGYDYLVSLSASGQPEGVAINFNPNTGTPDFTSTMTIQVGASVPTNTYLTTVTGLGSDGTTHSTTYTLTVTTVVPEFPIGLAMEILFIPVIIYLFWRNKQRKKLLP